MNESGKSGKNRVSKKEKSLLGKARAAINKLGFIKKDDMSPHETPEPRSAQLKKSTAMLLSEE